MNDPAAHGLPIATATAAKRRSAQAERLRRDWLLAAAGLVLLVLWEASGLDLPLQRLVGGHGGFPWRDALLTRTILHDSGRALAWCLFVVMIGEAMLPFGSGAPDRAAAEAASGGGPTRRERWVWIAATVVCLFLVPALKRLSHTSCPWDLAEFGGFAHYVPHWRLGLADGGPGHCFPSGHAVAAFGFFSVYFAWRQHRPRLANSVLAAVWIAGVLFGAAQYARGAHFVSHTLWSAWLCWVVCVVTATALN